MFGAIVLDDAFETIEPRVMLASTAVTKEYILAELFCQRLDFVIVDPFHVVQDELGPCIWIISRSLSRRLRVVGTSDVGKKVDRKLWAVIVGDCIATVPVLVDKVVGNGIESVADWALRLFPLAVHDFSGFLGVCIWVATVCCSCGD
jgi:hypothetical protein